MTRGVSSYFENNKKVAMIDNTNATHNIVILIDEKEKYIQDFFIEASDAELVDRCREMRRLKLKSR